MSNEAPKMYEKFQFKMSVWLSFHCVFFLKKKKRVMYYICKLDSILHVENLHSHIVYSHRWIIPGSQMTKCKTVDSTYIINQSINKWINQWEVKFGYNWIWISGEVPIFGSQFWRLNALLFCIGSWSTWRIISRITQNHRKRIIRQKGLKSYDVFT